MENVIRDIVKEELKMHVTTSTTSTSTTSTSVAATKSARTEGRLSGLISKIRGAKTLKKQNNSKSNNCTIKTKKFQIKWSRLDPYVEKYEMVKVRSGGGYRFLKVEEGLPITFGELKTQAINIFFDNKGMNNFLEHESECYKELCGPKGETLSEDRDLWEYVETKGLFLSKCYFILSTKSVAYDVATITDEEEGAVQFTDCQEQKIPVPGNDLFVRSVHAHTQVQIAYGVCKMQSIMYPVLQTL